MAFEQDIAVERLEQDRFAAEVSPDYATPAGAPNGGYLTAIAASALLQRLDVPDPLTVTTHYLAPPSPAPVEIHTEALKPTGRNRIGTARLVQGGTEVLRVTGVFTDLSTAAGPTHVDGKPPQLPPPDECVSMADLAADGAVPRLFGTIDLRGTARSLAWTRGESHGDPSFEGWTSIRSMPQLSTVAVLFLADAIPPPIFNLPTVPFGWMPTLELTVQVRRRPAPGRLAARFATRFLTDGYLELDGELWDDAGHLVALARQTALAPRPA